MSDNHKTDIGPIGTVQPTLERVVENKQIIERRLVRKLDIRLLPTIFVIYIMNQIDRNAITTARLQGLEQDLGLSDLQYSVILSILYATYCTAQIPSNMILGYVSRPSIYIGACVAFWGVVSALTGVTQNFHGLLACRLVLGLPEAAFYPGTIFVLSSWYTKKELAFRSAILLCGHLLSNAFGSLMAAGILGEMEGKRGIRAWRWLFFIEGSITIFLSFVSMWLLPDCPHNTRWMTPEERQVAQARLADDAGEADLNAKNERLVEAYYPLNGLKLTLKDYRVYAFAIMHLAQLSGLSFGNFFPTLTQTLGYSTTVTLLLAAPPWIFASIMCCLCAWHADRTGERFFHIAGWWWGVMLGFIMALSSMSVAPRYLSLFLMACGYCGVALTAVWVSNVVSRPRSKRAAAIGVVNGVGNLGTLIGSYAWKAAWGPRYHPSLVISFGALAISTVIALGIRTDLVRSNRRLDEGQLDFADQKRVEEAARLEGITFDEAMLKRRGYRYLY